MVDRNAPDFLYPLSEFFACSPLQAVALLESGDRPMPEPYRSLLVHESDMTSTLERFHRERIILEPVASKEDGGSLYRQVVLKGVRSRLPFEFGAIRIALQAFTDAAREEILAAEKPLGGILADHKVPYRSRPRCFFGLRSDPCMEELLELDRGHRLYGRQNVLWAPDGQKLAEVVEILPPTEAPTSSPQPWTPSP